MAIIQLGPLARRFDDIVGRPREERPSKTSTDQKEPLRVDYATHLPSPESETLRARNAYIRMRLFLTARLLGGMYRGAK